MTSYIKTNESWIHEASQKALEQLRLRWKERVDVWVAKVNLERSKPRWFGLVKGLEPTLNMQVLENWTWDNLTPENLLWSVNPKRSTTFKSDESRLLDLINATKAESTSAAFLSIEDSVLINKYSRG